MEVNLIKSLLKRMEQASLQLFQLKLDEALLLGQSKDQEQLQTHCAQMVLSTEEAMGFMYIIIQVMELFHILFNQQHQEIQLEVVMN